MRSIRRAVPPGKAILWLQLPEAPRHIKGDAAGKLDAPADGKWTDALREAYADRVEAILASHIDGFKDSVIARRAYSPADLEAMNINLVGGDPYGGSSTIDQSFLWRPFKDSRQPRDRVTGPLSYRRLDASGRRVSAAARASFWRRGCDGPEGAGQAAAASRRSGQIGLQQFAPYLMNRIMGRYNATLREDLRKQGLTIPQVRTLAVLSVMDGVTVNDLSVYTVIEQSTLSRTLDALEAQGLVRREQGETDSRVRKVFLTDDGPCRVRPRLAGHA